MQVFVQILAQLRGNAAFTQFDSAFSLTDVLNEAIFEQDLVNRYHAVWLVYGVKITMNSIAMASTALYTKY